MPRGKLLTEREIGAIFALDDDGKSNRKIATAIGRSEKAVRTVLRKKDARPSSKKVGKRTLLKKRIVRRIFQLACVKQMSSRNIAATFDHVVDRSTVLRVLRASKFAKYVKRKPTPHLKKHHRAKRMAFAKHHLNKIGFWERVLFMDEKKFNLDEPGGCQHYWHDSRKEVETYFKRVVGGGSVMIWAAFSDSSKIELKFLSGKADSTKYIATLRTHLQPFINTATQIFQQDNAPCHSSRLTKTWLEEHNIEVMPWPTYSSDLNY